MRSSRRASARELGRGTREKKDRSFIGMVAETLALVVFAIVLAAVIKAFLVQAFYVPSGSMEDTLLVNDRIMVEKVSGWDGDGPSRGDLVVFKDPGGWLGAEPTPSTVQRGLRAIGLLPSGGHLVKRVIGVGGDTVSCCDPDGRLLVNDEPLEEPYLRAKVRPSEQEFAVTVPEGSLWMMGDNRNNSEDSRAHLDDRTKGFVDEDLVVGRVFVLIWPWDRWRWFGF